MGDIKSSTAFVILMFGIAALFVLFSGDPDIADAWRCRALEIPMAQCKAPPK